MNADQITAVAAAIVAILGAITAFIVALRPLLMDILTELRGSRKELAKNTQVTEETHEELARNTQVTEETHVLVNSAHEAVVEQKVKAENRLAEHGIPLPYDSSRNTQVIGTEEHK